MRNATPIKIFKSNQKMSSFLYQIIQKMKLSTCHCVFCYRRICVNHFHLMLKLYIIPFYMYFFRFIFISHFYRSVLCIENIFFFCIQSLPLESYLISGPFILLISFYEFLIRFWFFVVRFHTICIYSLHSIEIHTKLISSIIFFIHYFCCRPLFLSLCVSQSFSPKMYARMHTTLFFFHIVSISIWSIRNSIMFIQFQALFDKKYISISVWCVCERKYDDLLVSQEPDAIWRFTNTIQFFVVSFIIYCCINSRFSRIEYTWCVCIFIKLRSILVGSITSERAFISCDDNFEARLCKNRSQYATDKWKTAMEQKG